MDVRFRLPPHADSPLARLDARWRLLALVLAAVAVCLLRTPPGAGAALALGVVLAWLAAVPGRWLAERLAVLLFLLLLFALPAAFLSLGDAAVIVGRGLALALLASALVVAAPLDRTFRAAASLGAPAVLVHVALLAYRYLFLIGDELGRLRIALRVRGFRNRSTGHAWKAVAAATGTLLVR
ncbi:MAG: hypothetical protein K2W96_21415, partial [Gemmataceae bacterium]|nr:hypothetical protein [Gemmataceae bacterium]